MVNVSYEVISRTWVNEMITGVNVRQRGVESIGKTALVARRFVIVPILLTPLFHPRATDSVRLEGSGIVGRQWQINDHRTVVGDALKKAVVEGL